MALLGSRSAGWVYGLSCCPGACTFWKGPRLSVVLCGCLEILTVFEQEDLRFHVVQGLANYVAGPNWGMQ